MKKERIHHRKMSIIISIYDGWRSVKVTYDSTDKVLFSAERISENSEHWMWRKNGIARHAVTISELSANTAHKYRIS